MKKILLSIFMLTALVTNAQNIFRDDFSTYNTGVNLSGQGSWSNSSSLPGGGGSCTGVLCPNSKVVNTGMSYSGYGSAANSVSISRDQDAVGTGFTPVTSGDVYFAFVLNLSSVPTGNSDFLRILNGGNFNTVVRIVTTSSSGAFFLGTAKNTGPYTTTSLAYGFNQDHLIVIKFSQIAGSDNDLISVYIDPAYANGEPVSPTIQANAGADAFSGNVDRLMIRQNTSTGSIPTGRIGLVSVAKTWADLTFNLSNNEFNKNTFTIASNQVSSGIISVKSSMLLENASLNIYDIQGRKVETKMISLQETVNDIAINPIKTSGIYIVEIISKSNQRFSQKIVVN